ncbi:MAG: glutamate synthase-related protein [Deferrisomatales bacterium]
MIQWPKQNDALGTVNRGQPTESGLCTLCESGCKGKCETWLSALVGRKLLYPRDFGSVTAGAGHVSALGIGYHALRIQGYPYGAQGLPPGLTEDPEDRVFSKVDLRTRFGRRIETVCRIPLMTGALGSTSVAAKYWNPLAVGAALCGFPIVVGENVVGVDPESRFEQGKVRHSPELDRRIEIYMRYYDGHGAIIVQMNVEDTRNGVAEYVIDKYGDRVILELKWGQGAKDIGGEIQVTDIDAARFLRDRGYLVDPDPHDPVVEAAYKHGAITSFARHSRLGATDLASPAAVEQQFKTTVESLRKLGYGRITLKTGAYGLEGLAMALRYAADCRLDLVTVDGAGGGTGMSPWNMMQHWGLPSLLLHAKVYEYCRILEERGVRPPDIALAGGLGREDHVFKALALCAPYARLVCMGRAPMVPGFLGSNIEGVLRPERRAEVAGHWDSLPSSVRSVGSTPEEIFAGWQAVKSRVGEKEMADIPFGAVALYTWADKIACGLQQFMAGARKFSLQALSREDLMSANRETAEVTGIPHATQAQHDKALAILEG